MTVVHTTTVHGYVTFRIGEREFAAALDGIREVLRLDGLVSLPGMTAPMAGVVELRGAPLPVMDLRGVGASRGDVLVLAEGEDAIGVAVDGVVAVRDVTELRPRAEAGVPAALPAYVVEVLHDIATDRPVLLVDLRRMLELAA
ncbi:MAG: chemotaxis protein CheW [Actinomycetes bacterium]